MARAMWSGSISFGLVNVPVRLFAAIEQKEVHFHLVHDADGARIREKRVCEKDGEEVPWEHVVKSYEPTKGRAVQVTTEELAQLAPEMTSTIDIEQFIDLGEIDPIYYGRTYYLAPQKGGEKAYGLLVASMRAREKVAIARLVLRTKQHLCAIRATAGALVLSTMQHPDEIRDPKELGLPIHGKPTTRELALADKLIESLEAPFKPEQLRDVYRDKVLAYLKKKGAGKAPALPAPEKDVAPDVHSLMEALSASLERKRGAKQPKRATTRRSPRPAAKQRSASTKSPAARRR